MVRHGYLELFRDDPLWLPRAEKLAARTYEFSEYLVDVLGITDLGARWPGKLTFHSSCHLRRALNVDRQPRALLSRIREAELVDLPEPEDCCGFGGVFSVEHPELSAEMMKRKLANFTATGAPTMVVCDTGCLMHLQGLLSRQGKSLKTLHLAQILDSQ